MAADVSIAPDSSSPCCAEIREKYEKMKKNRNDLKEAVNLYERLMNKIENEKNDLKKAFKEEKKKGNSEREAKDKEITVRKTLENELRELKAQVSSLSEESKTLNPSEKTGEEIERLKRLLDEEKKNASEAWNLLKLEKGKVGEERRLLGLEREKANKFENALDEEKQKASREKRLADAEKVKLEEQKKILEREKRRAIEERKRADGLIKKLGEERERVKELESRIASQNTQKEKVQIDNLLKQLEEERDRNKILETKIPIQNTQKEKIQINNLLKKLEEERERNKILQTKIASQNTQKEKIQIDNLLKKLEEEREKNKILQTNIASQNTQKGNFSKLEKEREKLKAKIEALKSAQSSGISVNSGNFEVKLLKEKLKFRKEQLKHVKNVLKLEKSKNNLIKQHFVLIKQDFIQLFNRFKLIDSHLGIEGTSHSTKVKPGIGLESPVMQKSRKSPSVPKSGTSSESIPTTNGQNIYKKHFTDKTLLQRGPQENLERERERASSVSSPVLQIPKISGNSLQMQKLSGTSLQIQKLSGTSLQVQKLSGTSLRTSPDPIKSSRKRKRNEKSNLDPKKKEKKTKSQNVNKKIQNSDFAEFEKRVRNGGVLKLLEFENHEMERKFKMAIERPLSPNIPKIAPRKIIKDNAVRNENLLPKLGVFEREIGSHLSEFNSSLDLMEIVTVNEENRSEEKCGCVNEKGDNLEGRIEKCPNLDYLVVFSSLKEESLERVKTLWKKMNFDESCKDSFDSRVLEIASKSELLSEERACVIYSLLASNICGKLIQNAKYITDGDFVSFIGSFRDYIYAVISEEVLKLLSESKILQNIISLMEDFINYKKVLVYKNGEFCAETPTKDQFISNCILYASISLKINRLDIILSFAYKTLLEGKTDISQTLLLVHIIIYTCGERLFCTNQERFLSRALRFVVLKLEKNGTGEKLGFGPCEKCPFEMDEKSFEGFVGSLLDEVEMCCLMRNPNPNSVCGESCSVYKAERDGLCYLMEIISLVELVAIYMDWEDVYEKVLLRLLKILESCKNEDFSAALLVLIGHLARFGVEKLGYEQRQISDLRQKLSNFIKTNENSAALPLQFASVGVFLNLIPLQFKEVIREDPFLSDKAEFCGIIGQIKSWFSQLSEEQKTVSQSLFMGSEGKEIN
ncbi:hypothetical protein LUZ60_001527 [Juncus effusus]|nr:hypothetical protein LUZ60_001527 [Juncus effusus]